MTTSACGITVHGYGAETVARKTLDKENLAALGAEALADLLLEVTRGNRALRQRLRLELSARAGPMDVARDIRKRFAQFRRASGFISWQRQRAFAREVSDLVDLIATRVAPDAPGEAFDLLWTFLQLAPTIHERTDDSNGVIGVAMDDAMAALADLAPGLDLDPEALADRVFEALQDNGYGEFGGAIPALAETLGPSGLERLKTLAKAAEAAPLTGADLARYDFVADEARRSTLAREGRDRTAGMILQDVADLQGDVDAYMARYSAEQLTYHTIAPDVAARLLAAGRAEEALQIIENARARGSGHPASLGRAQWPQPCRTIKPRPAGPALTAICANHLVAFDDPAMHLVLADGQVERDPTPMRQPWKQSRTTVVDQEPCNFLVLAAQGDLFGALRHRRENPTVDRPASNARSQYFFAPCSTQRHANGIDVFYLHGSASKLPGTLPSHRDGKTTGSAEVRSIASKNGLSAPTGGADAF